MEEKIEKYKIEKIKELKEDVNSLNKIIGPGAVGSVMGIVCAIEEAIQYATSNVTWERPLHGFFGAIVAGATGLLIKYLVSAILKKERYEKKIDDLQEEIDLSKIK